MGAQARSVTDQGAGGLAVELAARARATHAQGCGCLGAAETC
jgi:hypothetical protein